MDSSLFDIKAPFGKMPSSGSAIALSKELLNTTARDVDSTSPTLNTSYQAIGDSCASVQYFKQTSVITRCLSISLSVYLTYLLTSLGDVALYNKWRLELPFSKHIIIYHEYFINGYGYSWHSSRTIPFAFSALLLHVLIVLVHVVTVLWSRHPWHSSSWSSFGQIMILALRSTAPEGLGSVGAGVSSSETWNKSVAVRVVDAEDRLEMILQDGGLFRRIRKSTAELKKQVTIQVYLLHDLESSIIDGINSVFLY